MLLMGKHSSMNLIVPSLPPAVMATQISDFGMSRNLQDADYYVSQGGKVPVKWTAPEVRRACSCYPHC